MDGLETSNYSRLVVESYRAIGRVGSTIGGRQNPSDRNFESQFVSDWTTVILTQVVKISQVPMAADFLRYVGDKSGFSNDSETTISGIVSIKKALKIPMILLINSGLTDVLHRTITSDFTLKTGK